MLLFGCNADRGRKANGPDSRADSTTLYAPQSELVFGRYQLESVGLEPNAAWLNFRSASDTAVWRVAICANYVSTADSVYLRCTDTPIGTVTVAATFLDKGRPSRGLAALVVVEKRGRPIYRGRNSFLFEAH
jgi:hypothetical protein